MWSLRELSQLAQCACFLFVCLPVAHADDQVAVSGMVNDPAGAAIANAQVTIHWERNISNLHLKTPDHDFSLDTDARGVFSTHMPPGFYDLFIASSGFSPACRQIRLSSGHGGPYKFKLAVSRLMTGEFGDRFF
jgi:hypothetical protein